MDVGVQDGVKCGSENPGVYIDVHVSVSVSIMTEPNTLRVAVYVVVNTFVIGRGSGSQGL